MSNTLAIATVTATLQNMIQTELNHYYNSPVVNVGSPTQSSDDPVHPEVNIFLYQVSPNLAFRNNDLPSWSAQGRLMNRLQTALDLHYLISFYGDEKQLIPQRLLGNTVKVLHATPVLTPEMILNTINNPIYSFLQASDLAQQPEFVKFSLMAHSVEDLAKLWSIFPQFDYVLSVAYTATVVLIDDEQIPITPEPVAEKGVNINVYPFAVGPLNKNPPCHPATGISFSGVIITTNGQLNIQAGAFLIVNKATDERDVSDYMLYWSKDGVTRMSLLADLPKKGTDLKFTFQVNTPVPANGNSILVVTRNFIGEMPKGISYNLP